MSHSHAHHPNQQHHFQDMDQQYQSASLGMWLFLLTEILFFGGLFLSYALYRGMYPHAFGAASNQLSIFWGALNTGVLIASSFTMVMAVHTARIGNRFWTVCNLCLTLLLGLGFLGVKAIEYAAKFEHHLVPGAHFAFHGYTGGPGAEIFFSLYFGMTGLHAFHMIIGMGLLIYLIINAARGKYSAEYNTPVDMVGLYWHFVDIVWIFLFPLLYLIERH